ncbi:MAG: hypothetical protein K9G60_09650 [Pseudolabrys sp.]|nr:hypothetical protein [Pseudolabrys sp.]
MNRVKDHIRFAVWFVGLGYIALWPLTKHDSSIVAYFATFHVFAVCGQSSAVVDLICDPPQPLRLSPGLDLIGMLSAACVAVRLLLRHLRRLRQGRVAMARREPAPYPVAQPSQARRHRFAPEPPPARAVRPRAHFGLRGVPH